MSILILLGSIVLAVAVLIVLFSMFYTVVDPNQAHVIVDHRGRKVYSPSTITLPDGTKKDYKTSYFFIGFLMRRIIVSLENVKHEINEIKLHDKMVAPFKCDITCWFKITNPELAAEKLDVDANGNIMESIKDTLNAQVQGVARAAAMGQEVIALMRDRKQFSDDVQSSVNGDLDDWGVQLVKLEIIDFSDADGSEVIGDYQARRQAQISSETRKVVAEQEKGASVIEAETKKVSEKARLESEQEIELRNIEKQELVGKRNEKARLEVAIQQDKANDQAVKATRTLKIGEAEIVADAVEVEADGKAKAAVKTAEGKANAVKVEADATAEATIKTGKAEADVITATGTAKASAIGKEAEAQKKFTDASKEIEMAKLAVKVEISKNDALAKSLSNANINVVSEDMSFAGFSAKEGAGMGSLLKTLDQTSGGGIQGLVKVLADKIQDKPNVKG